MKNKKIINSVTLSIPAGNKISEEFLATNDVDQLRREFLTWDEKVERSLNDLLNTSYAAQFHNAMPYAFVQSGVATAGVRYWQNLTGKICFLNWLIIELRRAANYPI